MKKVCFNCGKDLGEQVPYEDKQTLVDVCRMCQTAFEKAKDNRIKRHLLQGGGKTLVEIGR